MNILEVRNLSLVLGETQILNNLSFDLWSGYVHAIMGPNGSGKSTLASTIMGLSGYTHYTGDILFQGNSLKDKGVDERAKEGITMAWQEPARFEGLPVKSFLGASGKHPDQKEIEEALSQVGMRPAEYMKRTVDKTLSGGERKKIELASLLLMKPKLALLDEPDSGIDIESINKIFDAIKILKQNGTTVALITHSLSVSEQAEHAFLICHGKIIDKGNINKINQYFKDECQLCIDKEPEIKGE